MDVELDQFQKDLLESVREMNERQAHPIAEVRPLMQERIDPNMSSSATRSHNVSQKLKRLILYRQTSSACATASITPSN
jgi:hypothetical protein